MRLLLDANLPKALVDWLKASGHQATHVLEIGLAQAKDKTIWLRAGEAGEIIVSKDEDFADLVRQSQSGPAVVWLHTGNGSTPELIDLIAPLLSSIEARLNAGDRLVEVR